MMVTGVETPGATTGRMLNDAGAAVTAEDEELTVQVTETAVPVNRVTTTFELAPLPETTEALVELQTTE